jgi:hypothetical protein
MASHPAYTRTLNEMAKKQLPELLEKADLVRELQRSPGWAFVLEQIADRHQQAYSRLLNETCKPEDVPRLRGLLDGLNAASEAAESIVAYAEEAERKANERLRAQEQHA